MSATSGQIEVCTQAMASRLFSAVVTSVTSISRRLVQRGYTKVVTPRVLPWNRDFNLGGFTTQYRQTCQVANSPLYVLLSTRVERAHWRGFPLSRYARNSPIQAHSWEASLYRAPSMTAFRSAFLM